MKSAAGILPIYNNKILLGIENNEWSPFAGMSEKNETPYQTACREAYEESCMLLQPSNYTNIRCMVDISSRFEYYLFIVDLKSNIDLNEFYINLNKVTDKHYKEKSELRWFSKDEIHQLPLRSVFKKSIPELLNFLT